MTDADLKRCQRSIDEQIRFMYRYCEGWTPDEATDCIIGCLTPTHKKQAVRSYVLSQVADLERTRVKAIEDAAYRERIRRIEEDAARPEAVAAHEQALREINEEFSQRRAQRESDIAAAFADYRQHVIVEWTTQLLGETFALGDGRRVRWGEATIADHEQRLELLRKNVEGNLHTMQLHEAAIETIAGTHAKSLDGAVTTSP